MEIKDNTTENNIVGKNKIKENDTKIIITLILEAKIIEKMITLSMSDFIQVFQQKIFSFQRLGSNLLHLIRVDRKYEFLKKFCFVLSKGTWSTFLVLEAKLRFGMLHYLKFPLFDVVLNVTCCATLMLNYFMLHNFNIVLLLFDAALFSCCTI